MIEQMKKVSIVLLNKEKETALKSLRKMGLLHLEKIEGSSEKLNAFKESTNNAIISESILSEIKLPKKKNPIAENLSKDEISDLCSKIVEKSERKKQLLEEISSNATELERFAKWGSVLVEDFDYLKQKSVLKRRKTQISGKIIIENIPCLIITICFFDKIFQTNNLLFHQFNLF